MPIIRLETNASLDAETNIHVAHGVSTLAADILGKPVSSVLAVVESGKALCFGGTDDPAACVTLQSIGLPQSETKSLSAVICAFLEDALSVSPDRVYILFTDLSPALVGWNMSTF